MPSDLLTSTAVARTYSPSAVTTEQDSFAKFLRLLEQVNAKVEEIAERTGLRPTSVSLTKTPSLSLPLGEWSFSPGANWLQLSTGDGTNLARVPLELAEKYPDVPKLLERAKMSYDVLCELLELFRVGGTTETDKLSAVFVRNDKPLNPTTVTTFINMLAVVNDVERA